MRSLLALLILPFAFQMAVAGVRPRPIGVPAGSSPAPPSSVPPVFFDRFRRHSDNDQSLPEPLENPELPAVPPALENVEDDCLFWQYIQAKPLTKAEVQHQIQELCVNNGTSSNQNGWCEIDLQVIIQEMNGAGAGAALRMESDMIQSVKELHIYIHFTESGLWQVLAIPDCPNNNSHDDKRFVRSLFKF